MLCMCTVICLGSQLPHLSGKLLYDCKATSPPYLLRLLIHPMFTVFPKLHGSPAGDLFPSLAEALALATRSRRECTDIRSKCQVHPWPTTTAAENNCRSLWIGHPVMHLHGVASCTYRAGNPDIRSKLDKHRPRNRYVQEESAHSLEEPCCG
jgi:hypothetical protein